MDGGSGVINCASAASALTDTASWHHIAMCKVGSLYGLYLDGTQIAYTSDASTKSMGGASLLYIGRRVDQYPMNGWIDEIRIQNGNYFQALPNGNGTYGDDTITVPTAAYSQDKPKSGVAIGAPLIF